LVATVACGLAQPRATRFEFRLPHPAAFRVDDEALRGRGPSVRGWPDDGTTNSVEFGSRVVLQVTSTERLQPLLAGGLLKHSRTVDANVFILQAPDAPAAVREAHRLARFADVLACYPVMERQVSLDGPYAYLPTDINFGNAQWPLERRNGDGSPAGVDINVRAA